MATLNAWEKRSQKKCIHGLSRAIEAALESLGPCGPVSLDELRRDGGSSVAAYPLIKEGWRTARVARCVLKATCRDGDTVQGEWQPAFRKVTTVQVVPHSPFPGEWSALLKGHGEELATILHTKAAELLRELVGNTVVMSRLAARHGGGVRGACELCVPILGWELRPHTHARECVSLVHYTPAAAWGDVRQALIGVAEGNGVRPPLADSAAVTAADAPHLDGPPVWWPRVSHVLYGVVRQLQKYDEAGVVMPDFKFLNFVVEANGWTRAIDHEASQVLPWPVLLQRPPAARRLHPVDAPLWSPLYAAPEMWAEDAGYLLEAAALGDRIARQRLLAAKCNEPGLHALYEDPALLSQLSTVHGGAGFACQASHVWLFGASLLDALEGMREVVKARAQSGGWRQSIGGPNKAGLARLQRLARACMVPRPGARPGLDWVAGQLLGMMA
ncbi:hypothetical protein HYH03_010452 [Edaphochlamys debaryana]|uniref:Uncharacterized protein n=1 Tax=Edaphochlamys debaryana TaxID=47281 RepID=A0A836BW98_9CHLO|nr:hypothetical protein HYH03_010452 [Edaphochlamys debaryana]|eukprot:KAG2491245.1 hypothetical protein HYH03_010452 [Edaphochlamys debaryana]